MPPDHNPWRPALQFLLDPFLLIKLCLLALPVVGVLSLVIGWRGRWVGNEPFCGHCGYNLTGLPTTTCPECGKNVQETGIVYGVRHRRPRFIVLGLFLLLLPAILIATHAESRLRQINWYQYKPTSMVITDTASADLNQASRAYLELDRRMSTNTLSASQCTAVATAALAELKRSPQRAIRDELYVDLLDNLRKQNKLTPAQQDQFLSELCVITMRARPESLMSTGIPALIEGNFRAGKTQLWHEYTFLGVARVGEQPDGGISAYSGRGGGKASSLKIVKVPSPGTYELYAKVKIRIFEGPSLSATKDTLLYQTAKTLTARSTVLAKEPPDFIKVVRTPGLTKAMHAAIQFDRIEPYGSPFWSIVYVLSNPPLDCAFKAKLISGDRTVDVATTVVMKKGSTGNYGFEFKGQLPNASQVDILLTPDIEYAKRSVDLTDIWGRSMLFKNVPVIAQNARFGVKPIAAESDEPTSLPTSSSQPGASH